MENKNNFGFFYEITGLAMSVHNKFGYGLLESAYEAGLKYQMELHGYKVERQVYLLMFWDDVQLDQTYRIDLLANDNIILELKAIDHIDIEHRRQLWNYMHLTHQPYGMLINFGRSVYAEWYHRRDKYHIDKITSEI